ncbi:hypothetical protein ACFL2T_00770 [Elusimicrobiota bacterium]
MAPKRDKVFFFLGAGASVRAGIPALESMTSQFLAHIQENFHGLASDLKNLCDGIEKFYEKEPRSGEGRRPVNIEKLLQILNDLIGLQESPLVSFTQSSQQLDRERLISLKDALESFIREKVISPEDVDYLNPILAFPGGNPVEVFSVNYDTCIERMCRKAQRRLVDGFDPEWNPRLISTGERDPAALYLYKLHGSVLWYKSEDGRLLKIPIKPEPKNPQSAVTLFDGVKAVPQLLYPAGKQPLESPLLDFMYALKSRLEMAEFVVVLGYSFADQHLRHLFRDALEVNSDLHLIIVDPKASQIYRSLMEESPAFRLSFNNRVTCLPFVVENYLQHLAESFRATGAGIRQWHDLERGERSGQRQNWTIPLHTLGRIPEPYLYNEAIRRVQIDKLRLDEYLRGLLKSLSLAMLLNDKALVSQLKKFLGESLEHIWKAFSVRKTSGEGFQVMCKFFVPATGEIDCRYLGQLFDSAREDVNSTLNWLPESDVGSVRLIKLGLHLREAAAWLSVHGETLPIAKFAQDMISQCPGKGALHLDIDLAIIDKDGKDEKLLQLLNRLPAHPMPQIFSNLLAACP